MQQAVVQGGLAKRNPLLGSLIVCVCEGPDGQRYYDITEGRFLTKDEAKDAR